MHHCGGLIMVPVNTLKLENVTLINNKSISFVVFIQYFSLCGPRLKLDMNWKLQYVISIHFSVLIKISWTFMNLSFDLLPYVTCQMYRAAFRNADSTMSAKIHIPLLRPYVAEYSSNATNLYKQILLPVWSKREFHMLQKFASEA